MGEAFQESHGAVAARISHAGLSLPLAEHLARQVLALPIFPTLPLEAAKHITELIQVFEQYSTELEMKHGAGR